MSTTTTVILTQGDHPKIRLVQAAKVIRAELMHHCPQIFNFVLLVVFSLRQSGHDLGIGVYAIVRKFDEGCSRRLLIG